MRRVCALAVSLVLVAACGDSGVTDDLTTQATTAPPTATSVTVPPEADGVVIHALTLTADGEGPYLVPVARESTPADGPATAVEMLLLGLTFGETGRGLSTEIPPGLPAHSVTTDAAGIVTVDLPAGFEAGGGSASMFGRLGQLVATVMRFPDVAGVRLAFDGTLVEVFSSEGIVLDVPMTMASIRDLIPPVGLPSPAWGAEVTVPFEVAGHEATATSVGWSLVDWDGRIITEGVEPVIDGAYAFTVPVAGDLLDPEAAPYQHTLILWDDADGLQQQVIEYVLTLRE